MEQIMQNMQAYIKSAPFMAFVLAYLGGLLTSLTPCVYPMIPVTAAFIGGSSAGKSPVRGLVLSVSYVLGMAIMYAGLGAAAALTGSMFGTLAAHPAVNIFIGVIFLLLGLGMMNVFMIPIPSALSNLAPKSSGGSVLGALTIGALSAIVATPCTAPVLLSILTYVAKEQNTFYAVALLFTFALGMGTLLVVVGTFAGAVASLPRSGPWMEIIKKVFGVMMILAAVYFGFQAYHLWFG